MAEASVSFADNLTDDPRSSTPRARSPHGPLNGTIIAQGGMSVAWM